MKREARNALRVKLGLLTTVFIIFMLARKTLFGPPKGGCGHLIGVAINMDIIYSIMQTINLGGCQLIGGCYMEVQTTCMCISSFPF